MAENRLIGRDNSLPWHLPKEMRHFMATTKGKPCIMGRKTFGSMPNPLKGRTNIVMTRDRTWHCEGVKVAHDIAGALALGREQCLADGMDEVMVVGGANVYAMALPHATRLYFTQVHLYPQESPQESRKGDIFFPPFDLAQWTLMRQEEHPVDEKHAVAYTINQYER